MHDLPFQLYKRQSGDILDPETGEAELEDELDYDPIFSNDYLDEVELVEKEKELVQVSPSMFTEFSIKVPNKSENTLDSFSFKDRPYLRLPYDTPSKKVLLFSSRQSEKSTMLANTTFAYCCINNSFNVLYVSPTNQQTKQFSKARIKEQLDTSEYLSSWTTQQLSDNVFEKQFINRSVIYLRYAFLNADRTRGISADKILLDEIQDFISGNIPVIEQCASHSKFKIFTYAGTPKSFENPIESLWSKESTQNEWVVPCEHHGRPKEPGTWHWNILGEKNIGKEGLICDSCGKPISPRHPNAQWASMNASVRKKLKEPFEGFRITRLMVPWLVWDELLDEYHRYPQSQFQNEVLGLSFDSGQRPLSRQDVIDNCKTDIVIDEAHLLKLKADLGGNAIYMGIDWGSGTENSFTVVTLATYINGLFTVFYAHRFENQELDPNVQIEIIKKWIAYWNPARIGVDYGGGLMQNELLSRTYGIQRVHKFQYSHPSVKVRWDGGNKIPHFIVHRSEVMTDIFAAIKRRDVFAFPNFDQFEDPFGKDMLNIFSEFNERTRTLEYNNVLGSTDDTFHSLLYCFLASMLHHPRPDILNPASKTKTINNGLQDIDG